MSVNRVYQNIENILQRIDTIKRRFGPVHNSYSDRFMKKLQDEINKPGEEVALKGESSKHTVQNSMYDGIIEAASKKFHLPAALIKAVIKQESNFNDKALSDKGAMGLMQLMPQTAELLGVENPYNAGENVFGGTRYLVDLISLYDGNLNKALAAYNAGPEKVKNQIPNINETKNFIDSVLSYYESYSKYDRVEEF